MARGLKFRILEVEGLYYLFSKNTGADQLRGYRTADLYLSFNDDIHCHLNCVMRKLSSRFQSRFNTNAAVKPLKIARVMKYKFRK